MLLQEEGRIMLSDNTKAFSESTRVDEDFLPYLKRPLDPEFELALRGLEYKELKSKLKDYLSENQIRALLERRDHILEWCGEQ
jgi:hypothetical protein